MLARTLKLKLCALIAIALSAAAGARAQQTHVFVSQPVAVWHSDGMQWQSIGGQVRFIGDPDACSWGPDRIDLFTRTANGHLFQIWRENGRWFKADHGDAISSSPTCVSWGPNRLDVFARGADGTLVHKAWNGERWTGIESLGGELPEGGAPDAASWGVNRLDVFIRGTDNAVWQAEWNGSRWAWYRHGGEINSNPGAVAWGPNRIDVFAVERTGEIVQLAFDGEQWDWFRHGAGFNNGIDPDASSPAVGRLDVFARRTDGSLRRKRWDGSRWSEWQDMHAPHETVSGAGAVALRGVPDNSRGRGRFRVTVTGFTVNRETWDDILHNDGKHDEVFLASESAIIHRNYRNRPHVEPRTVRDAVIIGDTNNLAGRRRGGRASDKGGFKTGDQHPLRAALDQLPAHHNSNGEPPFIAFEGEIVQGESAGLIMPTIWEWDPSTDVYDSYLDYMDATFDRRSNFFNTAGPRVAVIISAPARSSLADYVVSASEIGHDAISSNVSIGTSPSGEAASRPIGMIWSDNLYRFTPKVLVLTYEAAIVATRNGPPGSFGVVRMNYRDDDRLKGDYTLFLVVERLSD